MKLFVIKCKLLMVKKEDVKEKIDGKVINCHRKSDDTFNLIQDLKLEEKSVCGNRK